MVYIFLFACCCVATAPADRIIHVHDNEMQHALEHAQPGDLIIPTRFNYPAIDCVLAFASTAAGEAVQFLFIQITIAMRHSIATVAANAHLINMIGWCGGVDRCAIAFFVPPKVAPFYARQNIPGTDITQIVMTVTESSP